jgi:hypothetical protein
MKRLVLLFLAACGSSSSDDRPDAGPRADAGPAGAYPVDRIGQVNLIEAGPEGSVGWLALYASILDQPERPTPVKQAEQGDCAVFVRPPVSLCEPACNPGVCIDGTCEPFPVPASAGTISVSGLATPVSFEASEFGYVGPTEPIDDLFAAGASVTVSAEGDEVAAFTAELRGPAPLAAPFQNLTLVDGEDATVTWTAANDARIQLALLVGWHGAPWEALLLCETADDGSLTIPGGLIAELPRASSGLESHPSSLMRFDRALVDTPAGPIEIVIGSHQSIHFAHP